MSGFKVLESLRVFNIVVDKIKAREPDSVEKLSPLKYHKQVVTFWADNYPRQYAVWNSLEGAWKCLTSISSLISTIFIEGSMFVKWIKMGNILLYYYVIIWYYRCLYYSKHYISNVDSIKYNARYFKLLIFFFTEIAVVNL